MHDIEKSVRIVVTSGLVNQERFSKGLRESLEPRLRAVRDLPPSATRASLLDSCEQWRISACYYPALGAVCRSIFELSPV